ADAHDQVVRLDVTVDQAALMSMGQPASSLADVFAGLLNGKRTALLDEFAEVSAFDKFHGEEVSISRWARIVGMDHIGVIELAEDLDFAVETGHHLCVTEQLLADDLEGHNPVQLLMPRLEYLTGAPFAKALENEIIPHQQFLASALQQLICLIWRQPGP